MLTNTLFVLFLPYPLRASRAPELPLLTVGRSEAWLGAEAPAWAPLCAWVEQWGASSQVTRVVRSSRGHPHTGQRPHLPSSAFESLLSGAVLVVGVGSCLQEPALHQGGGTCTKSQTGHLTSTY